MNAPTEMSLQIELPADRTAPGVAREQVRAKFGGALSPERLADVQIGISELVGNAAVHGMGSIRIRAELVGSGFRCEVVDEGGGFEHVIRERGPEQATGRGLGIVAVVADNWGVHDGSTHVWFTMDIAHPTRGASEPQLGDHARPADLHVPSPALMGSHCP